MKAQRSIVSPFRNNNTIVFGVLFRYIFADGTELHVYMHELFRPEIHRILQIAIEIHGAAHVEMPRPGRPE